MSSNSTNNSLDATLDVLSHSTRRYVLWYLDSEPDAVPVESLAAAVAAWQVGDGRTDDERADDGSESDSDARRRAHVSLRHVHLPRLESAGLIERRRESETEYVEATLDGTPVSAFSDAGLLGEFAEPDRP